MKDNNDKI